MKSKRRYLKEINVSIQNVINLLLELVGYWLISKLSIFYKIYTNAHLKAAQRFSQKKGTFRYIIEYIQAKNHLNVNFATKNLPLLVIAKITKGGTSNQKITSPEHGKLDQQFFTKAQIIDLKFEKIQSILGEDRTNIQTFGLLNREQTDERNFVSNSQSLMMNSNDQNSKETKIASINTQTTFMNSQFQSRSTEELDCSPSRFLDFKYMIEIGILMENDNIARFCVNEQIKLFRHDE
ncbi:UNKNOWN [Stylonychia lemnae]|uniref:Transmembrane protein n=1 Tax=Stylonychia lemnae TaxID=5949 RepID=A0A078ADK0_STYLE|nr:UNKNOWN [Stylonychia lemnae]|eukprot:CDW80314.1 UNKNOWN [Stylonychia lemnae]